MRLRIGDILLMIFLVLLGVLLLILPLFAPIGVTAQIVFAETGEVKTIMLDTDGSYEITSRGIHLTVQTEKGSVFVSRSDCRDSICRNTPKIFRAGQSIVCAPAGIVVRIQGEEAVVDGVSG